MLASPAVDSLRPPQAQDTFRLIRHESRQETGPENWRDFWFVDADDDDVLNGYLFSDDVER